MSNGDSRLAEKQRQGAKGIPLRVLIVDDCEDDALLLIHQLKRSGFHPLYDRVDSAQGMQAALDRGGWDIVITDHNMAQFSSLAALTLVQSSGLDLPVIVVSGSIGEDIAVAAMKAGAHDYIMKNNLTRLVPAIERELREAKIRGSHREAEEVIRHMAYHDPLTDLVNRSAFEARLLIALASARDNYITHAVLYLDLDQFKVINDTCGHVAGDALLKQLAQRLRRQIRVSDTVARLGGDEFGVLLENCDLSEATQVAEHLRRIVKDFHFVWQGKPFDIGVSIGVVAITPTSNNVHEIMSAADMVCYTAKDLGRNRIHVYKKDDSDLVRRQGEMHWIARIKQAMNENRFSLFKQDIVSLAGASNSKASWEFLLRLRDADGNMVPPMNFIPAAERYNLMPELDRWVVDAALAHLADKFRGKKGRWENAGPFFINLSGTSLGDEGLFEFIRISLREHGVPPQIVCFEITETAAISSLDAATRFLEAIKAHGCLFALDDFGAGLSSFSYLKTLPVDFLKIDGGFVRNMLNDRMDAAIVEAINEIGHVAGIRTVAEFVETDQIRQKIQLLGVDYAQGYGISVPCPLDA